jgi:transcriptional regulator with XRE-family HTH domain
MIPLARERSRLVPDVEPKAFKLDQEIGARLRSARRTCGMSQTALGEAIGVTIVQVQRYEVGENRISASALILAARALDLSPLDLLGLDTQGEARNDRTLRDEDHAEVLLRAYKEITSPKLRQIVCELAQFLSETRAGAARGG